MFQQHTTTASSESNIHISTTSPSAVWSCNEWDPLEEVIVGAMSGARIPPHHPAVEVTLPHDSRAYFRENAKGQFPKEYVDAAERELEGFVRILEAEGVVVRRPTPVVFDMPFETPHWRIDNGLYAAMPRDILLIVGNEIIEAPMAWRCRYYESMAYRGLLKEYFKRGGLWTAAPKPELPDQLFDLDAPFITNEHEPTFDAADFTRIGRDIICQRSEVTNIFGIEWLRRHLGDKFRVHVLEFEDDKPMHIDATLVPLAPGKLLINPERVRDRSLLRMFKGWDVFEAPQPAIPAAHTMYMSSRWLNMNILMLDPERMVVEAEDEPMIRAAKSWGFTPVPVPFRNFNRFGGSFHCATADIRRRGKLESYLSL